LGEAAAEKNNDWRKHSLDVSKKLLCPMGRRTDAILGVGTARQVWYPGISRRWDAWE
jgi:hypothetical protein